MIRENNTLEWQEIAEQKRNDTKKDNTKKRKSTETKKKGMADPRAAIAVRLSSVFGRCAALPAESDPAVCESKRHFNGSVPGGAVVALREKQ